ncbi:MAG: isopeptide-forming domain-containing fimbrial protein, partial [Anaerolineae bacterium]|nr:isopeptide-forming domain-containing fimbrial protein [Anaerolineae bacterium]
MTLPSFPRLADTLKYSPFAIALLFFLLLLNPSLVLAEGTLNGSHGIVSEPVVGGPISFDISVTNIPNPLPGNYFTDRLYNLTAEVILPAGVTLDSCSTPVSSTVTNALGEATIIFNNIKNLEVDERLTINCTANLDASITIGTPFEIDYRWEANTLPDESGNWVYFPGPSDSSYEPIVASPQAFDLEKHAFPNTGEVQVNGAGAYAEGNGGPGVDWPYTYDLTLVNNEINPTGSMQVMDIIPPGVAYLGNDSLTCSVLGAPADATPQRTLNEDGTITLLWNFDTLYGPGTVLQPGENCTFGYQTAIPYEYRTQADGIIVGGGPFSGGIIPTDVTHENRYNATGNYNPTVDNIPGADGSESTPLDDSPVTVTSGYHSITKSSDSSTVTQDALITYTINGWISEYYDFTASAGTPYVIVDTLPDGLDYCGPGYNPNGYYDECISISTPTFNGAPLNPVSIVQDADFNLVITWEITDPTLVEASDTWELVFQAQVRDFYESDPTQPVSGLDTRNNRADASGEWNDRINVGRSGNDDTRGGSSITIEAPQLDKEVYDPDTGTWSDGPIDVEIGQRLTYRILTTFDDDLDMRNVIIDDFLPRGQRYVPDTADFTGSLDYPGTPQTAPGVGYSGTTYSAEEAGVTASGFAINDCPSPGRYPGPADPFYTDERFLGGLQDIIWRLCRVDNSDNNSPILWEVEFDAVVVDNPSLFDGYRVANFGNLSGTSSFGQTYSLRDNLDTIYIVPNLVVRKTNNAPDPLDVLAGTFAYTINVENIQNGSAYDWMIRDAIPAGVRIPGGGTCTGFATSAPGAYTCSADAGAQAGTGGFVTVQPDNSGAHDPDREFPPLTAYDFSFNAEIAPGATPDEILTNTASVEYCTQPTAADQNADSQPDRRCIGYLDPNSLVFDGSDTLHSDEGTPPTFQNFIDYVDNDDENSNGDEINGTDNSSVNIVAVDTDKDHIAPTHVDPQVTSGDYATIGEVYQVTLDVTIPGRTHLFTDPVEGYVEVIDEIQTEGAVFCDAASSLAGCADPVLSQSGALVSTDTTDSPTAPDWWQADNSSPATGSTVRFFLEEINNSADSDYTFTITFTMVVTGEDDGGNPVFFTPTINDSISNQFQIRYFNDASTPEEFTTSYVDDTINIDQPHISTDKEAVRITRGGSDECSSATDCNSTPVQGNDIIYYQTVYTSDGETTAMDVSLIDQLPHFVTYNSDMTCTATDSTPGGVVGTSPLTTPYSVELQMDTTPAGNWDLAPSDTITCTYSVTVDATVPVGTDLINFTDADWSTIDGEPGAGDPPERIFDDTPDDGNADEDSETIPVDIPEMSKVRTAPGPTGSPSTAQVRIGDVVDYTVTIPLPIGETRNLVVRDVLEPGLILYEGGSFSFITNSTTLTVNQTLNGSNDGIDNENPDFSVDWALSDSTCTGTPPCIINDGVNNTAITLSFQAVVADVPLNVDGLVLNNTVSASFIDGDDNPRTISEVEPFDDEDVQIMEPDIQLDKTVSAATADAGDTLTYTIEISNTATASPDDADQPTAYDVTWEDDLDPRVQYQAGTMSCDINSTPVTSVVLPADSNGQDPITVTNNADQNANTWDLRPGGVDVLTCTYDVLVLQDVSPGDSLDNTADADWSSLDGVVSNGPTEPNERIYDDSFDDGDDDTDTAQVQVPNLTVDKIVGPNTDPNYQADNQYQPGQLIPYQITIVLPEGTAEQLTVTDSFNTNLQYEAGSTTVTGATLNSGVTPNPNTATAGQIVWVLDDIVTTGTATTANPPTTGNTVTITYYLRVMSGAPNGATYTNTVSVRHDTDGDDIPDSTPVTDTASTGIERPTISVTKTENDADNRVDAADVITYTVRITNTRPANGGIAYDVYFDENLDNDTDFAAPSMACTHSVSGSLAFQIDASPYDGVADPEASTLDTFRVAGGATENTNGWQLNPGEYIQCTYQVVVNSTIQAGDTSVRNTVTGHVDSADNNQVGEVDVTANANTTLSTLPPSFTKTRTSLDDAVQAGEVVSYRIVVTIPEGHTDSLIIEDTLPTGFELISFTAADGWGGSPALPGFAAQPSPGDSGTLTWQFNTPVQNPGDNNTTNNTITLDYDVRVTSSAVGTTLPLNNGDDALNKAEVFYTPPSGSSTSIGTDDAPVDVLRPTISVIKSAAPTIVDAGDVVTYTVEVENTSSAVAYDVTFSDDLDDFTTYANNLSCEIDNDGNSTDNFTPVTLTATGADPVSFDTTPAGNIDLIEDSDGAGANHGGRLRCTYDATVNADVLATTTLENTVTATGTSADGIQPGEDTVTDNDNAQVNTPDPSISKDLDSADTVYAPGELVPYLVTITVPEGSIADLRFTDTLPTGLRFDSMISISGGFTLVGGAPNVSSGPGDGSAPTVYLFDFVDPVTVPSSNNTGTADYVDIEIRYYARVTNAANDGLPLINTVRGTYDTGNGADDAVIGTDTATITPEKPTMTTDKVITRIDPTGS